MSNKTLIWGSIVLVIILVAFARWYSGGPVASGGAFPGPHTQANTLGAAAGRSVAPDLSLSKLGGGTITLSEFRGKKPVVVDFWASWCPNCRRDMPNLNRYYEKYKDKVEVIGVNLQENENTVQNFITSNRINFPIALDPHGQASLMFGIQYTNTHFLIDKEGNLVRTVPGDIRESDIQFLLQ